MCSIQWNIFLSICQLIVTAGGVLLIIFQIKAAQKVHKSKLVLDLTNEFYNKHIQDIYDLFENNFYTFEGDPSERIVVILSFIDNVLYLIETQNLSKKEQEMFIYDIEYLLNRPEMHVYLSIKYWNKSNPFPFVNSLLNKANAFIRINSELKKLNSFIQKDILESLTTAPHRITFNYGNAATSGEVDIKSNRNFILSFIGDGILEYIRQKDIKTSIEGVSGYQKLDIGILYDLMNLGKIKP